MSGFEAERAVLAATMLEVLLPPSLPRSRSPHPCSQRIAHVGREMAVVNAQLGGVVGSTEAFTPITAAWIQFDTISAARTTAQPTTTQPAPAV